MNVLFRSELKTLMDRAGDGPCVSIYMPTHRGGPETRQDPIRFRNLLGDAEDQLKGVGVRDGDAKAILEPAQQFLRQGPWREMSDGLAAFSRDGFFRAYRLAGAFAEFLAVGPHWHIKPLVPLFSSDQQFYLLSLSLDHVRLYQCSRHTVVEVDLPAQMPRSLAEALRFDVDEDHLQWHTQTAYHSGKLRPGVFHGHGIGNDDSTKKRKVNEFVHRVDRGVESVLADERAPLILAGVEYLCATYRDATSYANLFDEWIAGNPDLLRPEHLQEKGWALLAPRLQAAQDRSADLCRQALAHDRGGNRIEDVVPAAWNGRVDTLFVPLDRQRWGRFDPAGGDQPVVLHEERRNGDVDLLDLAAAHTLLNDGQVYAVPHEQMPDRQPILATYRY